MPMIAIRLDLLIVYSMSFYKLRFAHCEYIQIVVVYGSNGIRTNKCTCLFRPIFVCGIKVLYAILFAQSVANIFRCKTNSKLTTRKEGEIKTLVLGSISSKLAAWFLFFLFFSFLLPSTSQSFFTPHSTSQLKKKKREQKKKIKAKTPSTACYRGCLVKAYGLLYPHSRKKVPAKVQP